MKRVRFSGVHVTPLKSFAELRQVAEKFAAGRYGSLVIWGPPGVAKSTEIVNAMWKLHVAENRRWAYLKGTHTPLDLYARAYEFAKRQIVLDDLDAMLKEPKNTAILKALCETTPVKVVQWGSNYKAFQEGCLPPQFESISPVCVLANEIELTSANILAIHDRAAVFKFDPTAMEIHEEVARGGWFADEEVFSFLGANLHLMIRPSFRVYVIGSIHRQECPNYWKEWLLTAMATDIDARLVVMAKVLADDALKTEAERVTAFGAAVADGGSRASYFRVKKELLALRGAINFEEARQLRLGQPRTSTRDTVLHARRKAIEIDRDFEDDMNDMLGDDVKSHALNSIESIKAAQRRLLERRLQEAIRSERYEHAARIRDLLQSLGE